MNRLLRPIMFMVIAAAVVVSGCAPVSVAEERARKAEAGSGDIVVAAVWPFESQNDMFREGMELAQNEINAGGGIMGRQLRILLKDDQASVTEGLKIAQQLSDDTGIVAVIGHRNSFISVPAASVYSRNGLLMVSPASSAPALTQSKSPLVFRTISSDTELAKTLADAAKASKLGRIVILYDDDDYGRGLANSFEQYAQDRGIQTVDRLASYEDTDKLKQLKYKWEQLAYDGVMLAQSSKSGARSAVDLKKAGLSVPILGGNALDSAAFRNAAGSAGEGVIVGSYFDPGSERRQVREFAAKFQERYRAAPSQYSALGYDAVHVLAAAMAAAKSAAPLKVAAAMRELKLDGVIGSHSFAASGDDIGSLVVVKRFADGQFKAVNP